MVETLIFWALCLLFGGAFVAQVARRLRLGARAPNTFRLDAPAFRARRFIRDVVFQARTIAERPVAGLAHAFVFWGFVAFAVYTSTEFLPGLGVVDLRRTAFMRAYAIALAPFAVAVLAGILYLLVRRGPSPA